MKKFVHILVAVMLVIIQLTTITGAAEIKPLWENITLISCEVTFDGTDGVAYCRINGDDGVTKITGTLTLYEGSSEIMSWDIEEKDDYRSVLYAFDGEKGKTYRLELEAEVYKDGLWGPVEISDSTKCS